MARQLLLSVFLFFALAASLPAQAPRITPAGDPSIRADTIYGLAVDPAEYKAYGSVMLLEDGVMQIERTGTTRRTFRTVVQVLKQDAAEDWGEWDLSYRPDRERITLNWARVLRTDGTVLSDRPEVDHVTEESVDENHVYSGRMTRQLTLGGVAAGTIVDLSYTLETYRPTLPGDLYERWFVSHYTPVRRLRFILDAPARQPIRIDTPNLSIVPVVAEQGGRTVRTWTGQDIAALENESFAGYPNDVYQEIRVWGWNQWTDVGDWYAGLSKGRDLLTPAVTRAFAEVAGGTTEVDSLLRIAQRWVAQDFRYVSIGLGDGNYQPRLPGAVVQSRFGDCKDKAALFIALARSIGVTAYPVLLNSSGLVDSTPVSLERFDHAIAAVERNGELTFLDLTDDLLPYGTIPTALQGTHGLLVLPNGRSRWVQLPESPLEDNSFDAVIMGALGTDATFRGTIELEGTGTSQYWIRERLRGATKVADQRMLEIAADLAAVFVPGASVDSTTFNDGLSLNRRAFIFARLSTDRMVQAAGARYLLRLPERTFDVQSRIAEIGDKPRRFPIDAARLNDASTARMTLLLTLPPGWRAELPPSVSVDGLFGQYRSTYTQKGRTLRMIRELAGRWGNEPADSVAALRTWLRAVASDRAESILLDPAPPGPADPAALFTAPTKDTSTVALTFGWPVGMEVEVESERIAIQQEGQAAPDSQVTQSSSRMTVQDHPDGRLISFSDWNSSTPLDTALTALAERMGTDEFMAGFQPAYVVSGEGELLRLEGFGAIREVLDSMIRPKFDTLPNPTAARSAFLDRLLGGDFLLAKAREEWNLMVWSWAGVSFDVGTVHERDARLASPIMPEVMIPYHLESGLSSRVPCEEDAADSACVALVLRTVPDPKVFAPLVLSFLRETMGMPDSLLKGWRMEVDFVTHLVTEPETMIPHWVEIRRSVTLTKPDSAGGEETARQIQVIQNTYHYGPAPPPPRVDGSRLRPGRDSFAVYMIRGADTTKVGTAVDQLRSDGTRLTRVYRQTDTSGTMVDTMVARRDDLGPLSESVHDASLNEQLSFGADSVSVRVKRAAGDSIRLQVPVPVLIHDISMFDLVVRASDLNDSTHFGSSTFSLAGAIRRAEGRVTGSAKVNGRDCWVFSGFNGDFHVTFWIDKTSRTLRRSLMWGDARVKVLLVRLTP